MTDDVDYHRERATRELNLGLSTGSLAAARAHLKLSSLHFQKWRDLEGDKPRAVRPPFVL